MDKMTKKNCTDNQMERKAIVINGLSRGGTNLIWNILQSHPYICSPIKETGEILLRNKLRIRGYPFVLRNILSANIIAGGKLGVGIRRYAKSVLEQKKLENMSDPFNRFKFEDILYVEEEISKSIICLKSTDKDISLNKFLEGLWDDISYIGLIRDGYAICEGWMRRGFSPKKIGKFYRWFGEKLIEADVLQSNYTIVRFEDLIQRPFDLSAMLYEHCQVEPYILGKLRFKTKKILTQDGKHRETYGLENYKYWVDRDSVADVIDPNVSRRQIEQLDSVARRDFEIFAMPILEHFGYAN